MVFGPNPIWCGGTGGRDAAAGEADRKDRGRIYTSFDWYCSAGPAGARVAHDFAGPGPSCGRVCVGQTAPGPVEKHGEPRQTCGPGTHRPQKPLIVWFVPTGNRPATTLASSGREIDLGGTGTGTGWDTSTDNRRLLRPYRA